MTILRATSAALAAAAFLVPSSAALAAPSPKGIWLNDTGRGAIEIADCGGSLCGHVVWVKSESDSKGCGKQILGEVKSVGGGRWDNGWIYSPEKKQRFDVELTPLSNGRLQVMGYAGMKLFSKTMIWTKAPDDLKRCDGTTTAAAAPKPAPASAPAAKVETAQAEKSPVVPQPSQPAQSAKPVAPAKTAENTATEKSASEKVAADKAKPVAAAAPPAAVQKPAAPALSSSSGKTEDSASAATETGSSTEEKTASADEDGDDPTNAPKAQGRKLSLGDIDFDKIVKRTADGKCKLDLPFVKVHFNCDN